MILQYYSQTYNIFLIIQNNLLKILICVCRTRIPHELPENLKFFALVATFSSSKIKVIRFNYVFL
jgi:hypothetical protein